MFAVTWEMHGQASWLTVRLAPAGDGTDLELEHVAHVDDAFWDQFGPGAVGVGWDLALMGLAEHLDRQPDGRSSAAPRRGAMSDEGKAFAGEASERVGRRVDRRRHAGRRGARPRPRARPRSTPARRRPPAA